MEPIQTNLEALEIYLKSLLSELHGSSKNSLLYCILVHHLNRAIFGMNPTVKNSILNDTNEKQIAKLNKLINSFEMSNNIELKQIILKYSHISSNGLILND